MNKKIDKIVNATIQLFVRDGIKNTTMDEISQASNASKVTIYKYFQDKDTLYLQIGKHIFSRYIIKLNSILASDDALIKKLYDYLNVLSDFINCGQFNLCIELAKYNRDVETEYNLYLQTYKTSMLMLIDNGINDCLIKSDLNRDMIFHYIDMGIVYYQQNSDYRYKMLNDRNFQKEFLLFYISNIFIDGAKMLSSPDEKN